MTPTQFIPTRRVRFKIDVIDATGNVSQGWRSGEVVATSLDQLRMSTAIPWSGMALRIRDPLTGIYWDVPAALCEEDGPRDDKGNAR